ncbi:MAG: hypothetical protein K6U88_04000, partial [Dehalococcoidia bacterium]|nr:hypothetical protein [Dehalococcoidia bacterium]
MGSLQVRLLFTYLFIIAVTLFLAALSLFLQIGGYRDDISYGNLEDLGRLINAQANAELQARLETAPGDPVPTTNDLLLTLRSFLGRPNRVSAETALALVDANGRVIP